jgi:hypothetical protein
MSVGLALLNSTYSYTELREQKLAINFWHKEALYQQPRFNPKIKENPYISFQIKCDKIFPIVQSHQIATVNDNDNALWQ